MSPAVPMHSMSGGSFAAMGIFWVVWLLLMVPMWVGWIILLVAAWRAMKAHERIATALDTLAERLPAQGPPTKRE